jgi:hypothetical protein
LPVGSGTVTYDNGDQVVGYARQGCVWSNKDGSGDLLVFFGKTENQCLAEKK